MLLARMIPLLWVRLAVLVGFGAWLTTTDVSWLALICLLLIGLTAWQLRAAYRAR